MTIDNFEYFCNKIGGTIDILSPYYIKLHDIMMGRIYKFRHSINFKLARNSETYL